MLVKYAFASQTANALLNGGVFLALFFAALCKKSDKNTESVAATCYAWLL